MADTYDLIVLGGGSGGLATATRAARHGARVALLEPHALGGTCVNVGCVPKKALWFAAQLAQAQTLARSYGFAVQPGPLDWEHFRQLRQTYIDGIRQRYAARLSEVGVRVYAETGRFVAADRVATSSGDELQAPHIVIATGGRPRRVDVPGFELGMVSDDIFAMRTLPRRVAVVGGGYIAVEFAGLLRALGSEVTLLVRGGLLSGFDGELVDALEERMRADGIEVRRGAHASGLRREGGGLIFGDANLGDQGPFDAVLWAVGRTPNSDRLDIDAAGVSLDAAGRVITDAWQNTTAAGVYAVGDITTGVELTPVAVAAGRCLADRLFGQQPYSRLIDENIPTVVFAEPPLAQVGLSEAAARERYGDQVRVYRSRFTPLQLAVAGVQGKTLMKLVCVGAEERVLGIHVLGPGAEEMLQGFAVAMTMGLRKRDLDRTVAIHPSSAEELVLMS